MATDISGLFGLTPESYQLAQEKQAQEQALQYANMDPFQRANYGLFLGGRQLGGAIGQALGAQDPMLQQISQQQSLLKSIDFSNLDSIKQAIPQASAINPQLAATLLAKYQEGQTVQAEQAQKLAAARASLATASKNAFDVSAQGKGLQLANTGKYSPESIATAMNADGSIDISKLETIDKLAKPTSDFVSKAVELGFGDKPSYGAYSQSQVQAINKALFEEDIKKKSALASTTRIDLGTAIQELFGKEDTKSRAEAWKVAGEAYKEGSFTLGLLDTFEQNAKSGFTGAGADAKLAFSKGLSAAGIPISTKATDTEISNALSSQLVQKIAKVFPGSQSNKELAELLKSKPNMSQELPTILRLIDRIRMEIRPKIMTYEQLAKLPEKERAVANANIIEVENINKLKRLQELEAKAAGGR